MTRSRIITLTFALPEPRTSKLENYLGNAQLWEAGGGTVPVRSTSWCCFQMHQTVSTLTTFSKLGIHEDHTRNGIGFELKKVQTPTAAVERSTVVGSRTKPRKLPSDRDTFVFEQPTETLWKISAWVKIRFPKSWLCTLIPWFHCVYILWKYIMIWAQDIMAWVP